MNVTRSTSTSDRSDGPKTSMTPPCFPKSSVVRSPTKRRPVCRNPDLVEQVVIRRPRPPRAFAVTTLGSHEHWGLPTLKDRVKVDEETSKEVEVKDEEIVDEQVEMKTISGESVFHLPRGCSNPPGWWDAYEWRMSHLDYTTTNSEYAKYPPNAYGLPITYRVKDRSFTLHQSQFPFYRHRSLNVQTKYC